MKSAFFGLGGLIAQALKPKEVPPPPSPTPRPPYEYTLCPDMTRPNAQAELITMTMEMTALSMFHYGFGIKRDTGILILTQERYDGLRPEYQAHFRKMENA